MYTMTKFPNQQPNERIIMFLRRHWLFLFKIFVIFLILIIIMIAFDVGAYYATNVWENDVGFPIMILGNSAYFLFVLLFSFANFVDYYLDVWIVTNKRIVNVEQKGLFSRVVSEKELSRMQDVTSEVHGFIATFFNYGDIYIQTAGTKERFVFKQVPDAPHVAQEITNLVQKVRETEPLPERIEKTERRPANGQNERENDLL